MKIKPNNIYNQDCLNTGIPDGKIDLIYLDPPYNTGIGTGESLTISGAMINPTLIISLFAYWS